MDVKRFDMQKLPFSSIFYCFFLVPDGNSNLWEPEPYVVWELPGSGAWTEYKRGGQNLGALFAAKREFTWIVDLRLDDINHEGWSTGNLITPDVVLSTCQALRFLQSGVPRVTFCHVYLWEHLGRTTSQYDVVTGGTRRVLSYSLHPQCNVKTFEHDFGSIRLSSSISLESGIGFMPNPLSWNLTPYPKIDQHMDQHRIVCYVASFGRPYANFDERHLVLDYKVRYRVYWEERAKCEEEIDKICDSDVHDCPTAFETGWARGFWTCLRTRARVGTVCDHDRGSPLVCNDEVIGLVTLGAKFKFCNDLLPLPFIVTTIRNIPVT